MAGTFVMCSFRLFDLKFNSNPSDSFDSWVVVILALVMGLNCIVLSFRLRRAESCRAELEDQLLRDKKLTEQDVAPDG